MSNQLTTLTNQLANNFDLGSAEGLLETLKRTAFKGEVSDDQMAALLIVANQYKLNPWTKEIYAFPDKNNGIVPVVGVDGWSRIINEHPDFDGMEFHQSEKMILQKGAKSEAPEWMECAIYRKSRSKPTVVREYLDEVYREPFKGKFGEIIGPWQTHPKRFLRHKTMIQTARLAFGYCGIYDEDEAERIKDNKDVIKPDKTNPFSGNADNPERNTLIVQAEMIAHKGDINATRQYFSSLTKEQRSVIGTDEMMRIGELAKQAADNIIDAEIAENATEN